MPDRCSPDHQYRSLGAIAWLNHLLDHEEQDAWVLPATLHAELVGLAQRIDARSPIDQAALTEFHIDVEQLLEQEGGES